MAPHTVMLVDDPLPAVMTPADMQRAFRMKHSLFYRLLKAGHFDRFAIQHHPGKRAWSGALVSKHLREGGRRDFFFGRKKSA